jgi:hypothetical protein
MFRMMQRIPGKVAHQPDGKRCAGTLQHICTRRTVAMLHLQAWGLANRVCSGWRARAALKNNNYYPQEWITVLQNKV